MTVRALGESIDEAKDMLRADFANESIGGGSIAYGCVQVRPAAPTSLSLNPADKSRQQATKALISRSMGWVQEEIMFACHPELNCARLVFTPMQPDEAFVLCG